MKLLAVIGSDVAGAIEGAGCKLAGLPVQVVKAGSLAAVLAADEKRPRLTLFSRRAELMRLVDQQRMLEALLTFGPVLPARPDAVLATDRDAAVFLEANAELLREQLGEFGNSVQYQITISGQSAVTDVRSLASEALLRAGRDLMHLPIADADMLANIVVLIERGTEAGLEGELEAIDRAFEGQCRIRMIGPMPPVSFAAIDITPFNEEAVEAACSLLGVTADLPAALLRRAYLALVSQHHPDRTGQSPGKTGGEAFVGQASEAYKLLVRYQAARRRSAGEAAVSVDVVRQSERGAKAA